MVLLKKEAATIYLVILKLLDVGLTISTITKAANGVVTTSTNHGYATNDLVYIANATGMTQVNDIIFTITVTGLTTFQLNVDTSAYGAYTGSGTVAKVLNDADRVMGISRYLSASGLNNGIVFSTTRANIYNNTIFDYSPLDSDPIMSGSDTDFVWTCNWQSTDVVNRLYFSNGKAYDGSSLDGIRYYDASGTGNTTTSFTPDLGGGNTLYGGILIFALKQRLVVLGTYEYDGANVTTYPQRARWCQAQGPSNWNDIIPGGGGFTDAPTGDHIISARQLSDQIIVFFTESVWTLRPTSNPALPFRWDKINSNRACDGKMASVGYDRYVKALGIRGITATDGVQTKRIDERILDFVTDSINVDEFAKVYCERSYANQRWWTLYPYLTDTENSSALIFDDESGAYTTYTINLNCLGYGNFAQDYALNDFTAENNLDIAINDCTEETLLSYFWQENQETLLGGNTTGQIYILETEGSDEGESIDVSIKSAGWNPYQDQGKESQLNYVDIYADTDRETIAMVNFFKDDMVTPYASQYIDFLPNLNFYATIQDISNTNPCVVFAPQHGRSTGDIVCIYGVQGMSEINDVKYPITVIDEDTFSLNNVDATGYGVYSGGGSIYERQFYKTKVWKRAYGGGIGYLHQIEIESSGTQDPLTIHAFKPYFKQRGKRTINS